ncbi:polysaccharide biosynthesis/export family protein [Halomonas qinghailakensis]|uniref:Polysaccharide biosynthesis/export family protein n=1 Tax=Halomonas qinghailakensis TaxID=2937790 RepID=A0AA46TPI4_9GAMM|nr:MULTISPECIES: polysaccharide biosynthesis/export family protein [Halomonas]UYO73859.1 polysaccharide biosynthesis/export family protein [Halomonas sp. ZZQ-149]HBS82008.1 capsid assembly protein [Halomonas campaniensis]
MNATRLIKRLSLKRPLAAVSLLLVSSLISSTSWAQSISLPNTILPEEQASQQQVEQVNDTPRADWRSGTYGPVSAQPQNPDVLPPFGANLFTGGFRGAMGDGLNAGYQVKPGDQITVRVWGALEFERVLPVDAQGNIFIPGSGPLNVEGQNSQQVESSVRGAITSVYPENVQVYTNVQGVQPVAVFVTGYVENPGRFAGTPNDSVLYFLDQAGGIDQDLGSYRQIRVMRNDRTVATVDLYDFLINGSIARPQFQDGDTIVVEERGPAIAVGGDVHREHRYELLGNQLSGAELVNLARLRSGVSHVLLRGNRDDGPFAQYFPLDMFYGQTIRSGDEVLFSADKRSETIVVEVEGSYYGPSRFALPRDARLSELLDAIPVPENMTAVESISLQRESVRQQQKQSMEDSLRRLETTYLSAESSTNEEAKIRAQEAELIQDFVERARELEPSGRLVVAYNDRISDIRLQDGDIITIPEISDSMLISGEVLVPQAAVFRPGMNVIDYIESAGGFTNRADEDHILIVRQNGAVENARNVNLRPGDEILVMPAAPTHNLQLASTLTQILFQIAVATRVAVDL